MTNLVKTIPGVEAGRWGVSDFFRDIFLPQTLPGAIFYGICFALVAWAIGRAVHLGVQRLLARDTHGALDRTTVRFLSQLARVLVYVFAFVSYAHVVPSLQQLGRAWLASVGVASVVVGLAAQSTLGNLIAGVSLVLYRPFKIGDQLQITAPTGLETGTVESINLGYTVLRTDDDRMLVMPNSLIAGQTSVNLSGTHPTSTVAFKLTFDADVDKARKILTDIAVQHPNSNGTADCKVTALTPGGVTLTLMTPVKDGRKLAPTNWDLMESAKREFDKAGIPFQRDDKLGYLRVPEPPKK
jgi:small-conductance mechanosensitive channel